jgi:hypothetical protein
VPALPRATAADVEWTKATELAARPVVHEPPKPAPVRQSEEEADEIRASWARAFGGRRDPTVFEDGI